MLSNPGTDTDLAEARRLIAELAVTPQAVPKVRQLFTLLARHPRDDDLLREVFTQVPPEAMLPLMQEQKDTLRQAIRLFVGHVLSQTWGATYLDRIGTRCGNLFLALKDEEVRADLLSCILRLGIAFKRYAVLEILAHLIQTVTEEPEKRAILARLRDIPAKVRIEAGRWLELDLVDPAIAAMFKS
jgi:hypothetical protein